ncbi:MAG: dockerin type I repeat-containing protein, partial [Clostridiales bacterium]|nr:dockerin type I repeat-containing protein [Clostridiales bacterium]
GEQGEQPEMPEGEEGGFDPNGSNTSAVTSYSYEFYMTDMVNSFSGVQDETNASTDTEQPENGENDNGGDNDDTVLGDINGDGEVTAADARLALRMAAQLDETTEYALSAGDFDGSGSISASEARQILRVAAKLDSFTVTSTDNENAENGDNDNGNGEPEKPEDSNFSGGNTNFGGTDTASGTAANTIDEDGDYSDLTYISTGDDENALLVDGAIVSLYNITVDKSSGDSSNTENGDFTA